MHTSSQGWGPVRNFGEFLGQLWTNSWSRAKYLQEHWRMPSSHVVGTQSPTHVLSIPSLSKVPSLLFYLGLGGVPSGDFFSSGSWWDLHPWTRDPQTSASITRPHGHHERWNTHTYTHVHAGTAVSGTHVSGCIFIFKKVAQHAIRGIKV